MRRTRKYWALAAATAIVLSACSNGPEQLPVVEIEATEPSEDTSTEPESSTGANQPEGSDKALQGISEALETAYDERSVDNVTNRIGGPARPTLRAIFANAERFDVEDLEPIPTGDPDSLWGSAAGFPRIAMVFAENPDTGVNDQLLVLSQSDGRENYKLWGYAKLLPADAEITFLPDTQSLSRKHSDGIEASPIDTVEAFAQRLQGDDTDLSFAEDPLTVSVEERRDSIAESLGDNGEARLEARALNHGPVTLTTEDGGAVTVGAFEYDVIIERTAAGSTISVADKPGQWMTGEADSTYDVEGTLTSTYMVTVAFYIPPEGGDAIQVIAASSPELIAVTDDDSTNPD